MIKQKIQLNLFGNNKWFKNWYRNLTHFDKQLLFGFLGLIILILLLNLSVETFRNFDNDLSTQECNQLRIDDVRSYLSLQEDNNILAFIYSFKFPFTFLLACIGISWVLHGVGFNIIRR